MDENVTLIFHGFLNLNSREKLRLTEEINRYFDANDEREQIRATNEEKFQQLKLVNGCKCCGN